MRKTFLSALAVSMLLGTSSVGPVAAQESASAGPRKNDNFFYVKFPGHPDAVKRCHYYKITPKENDIVLIKGSRSMKMEGVFRV